MKKSVLVSVFAAMVLFSGCDMFRSLAGRPTSDVIEARRSVIEANRLAERQAKLDSIAAAEKQAADSIAAMDSLKSMKGAPMLAPGNLGGLAGSALAHKYYVIIGSFMDRGNAAYLQEKAASAGYEAVLINFRNGYTAVGVSPCDNVATAYSSLKKVSGEPFSPDGVWILAN